MILQFSVCGFTTLGYGPSPAPPPSLVPPVSGWLGVEPDGTPLVDPLRATAGTTLSAMTTLGRPYGLSTVLSAAIADRNAGGAVVRVPHVEWVEPTTGLVRLTIGPSQLPEPSPEAYAPNHDYEYRYLVVLRTITNGVDKIVRETPIVVWPQFVAPPETT